MRKRSVVAIAAWGILLLAVTGLALSQESSEAGSTTTVSVSSASVTVGGSVTVDLTVSPAPGVSVGAMDVRISYDNTRFYASHCTVIQAGVCNAQASPNQVAYGMSSLSGIPSDVGSVTFNAISSYGSSPLQVVVTSCADVNAETIVCEGEDGVIEVVPYVQGDVDCDNVVNSIDALKIIRYSADLNYAQPAGCPDIGLTPP
jgi:hypothetical protein